MPAEFLQGSQVWKAITPAVRNSKVVWAAVSYFGSNGTELLPLKRGDHLVVDMSLPAVRQGVTDPREIKKLLRDRVVVCSRSRLHAKLVVADATLFVGSMNASKNSAKFLDEAGIRTTSSGLVRAAREQVRRWAVEPVLEKQLEEALREYRPPIFVAARTTRRRRRGSAQPTRARLWVVGGLTYGDVPEEERTKARVQSRTAVEGFRRTRGTSIERIHAGYETRYYRGLRRGDWVIQECEGDVYSPARVAGKTSYSRGHGKRRFLVLLEQRDSPLVSVAELKRAYARVTGMVLRSSRTRAIRDHNIADVLMGCWSSATGRPRRKLFKR